MKKNIIFAAISCLILSGYAQNYKTYCFAVQNQDSLFLDLYSPNEANRQDICMVYVFGGGFMSGARNQDVNQAYCQALADKGFTVAAIDYRLGLKGVTKMGITAVKTLENAINLAVEDLYSAVAYLLKNANQFRINPQSIVTVGTSAGGITVLQADYDLCNGHPLAQILPADFHFAGVISFSGAILSREGKVDYKKAHPAPTLFYHGTADKLVTYNQIRFANIGFFGSNKLVKRFNKFDFPYFIMRYYDLGHEVAGLLTDNIESTQWFINQYVKQKKNLQVDQMYNDPSIPHPWYSRISPQKLYKGSTEETNNK